MGRRGCSGLARAAQVPRQLRYEQLAVPRASGAQMRNRAAALAAAADGGAAAAAAAKTGSYAERGPRALGPSAASGDARRPSGCLRKRPRAAQSAAAAADYSKVLGLGLGLGLGFAAPNS